MLYVYTEELKTPKQRDEGIEWLEFKQFEAQEEFFQFIPSDYNISIESNNADENDTGLKHENRPYTDMTLFAYETDYQTALTLYATINAKRSTENLDNMVYLYKHMKSDIYYVVATLKMLQKFDATVPSPNYITTEKFKHPLNKELLQEMKPSSNKEITNSTTKINQILGGKSREQVLHINANHADEFLGFSILSQKNAYPISHKTSNMWCFDQITVLDPSTHSNLLVLWVYDKKNEIYSLLACNSEQARSIKSLIIQDQSKLSSNNRMNLSQRTIYFAENIIFVPKQLMLSLYGVPKAIKPHANKKLYDPDFEMRMRAIARIESKAQQQTAQTAIVHPTVKSMPASANQNLTTLSQPAIVPRFSTEGEIETFFAEIKTQVEGLNSDSNNAALCESDSTNIKIQLHQYTKDLFLIYNNKQLNKKTHDAAFELLAKVHEALIKLNSKNSSLPTTSHSQISMPSQPLPDALPVPVLQNINSANPQNVQPLANQTMFRTPSTQQWVSSLTGAPNSSRQDGEYQLNNACRMQ